MRREVLRRRSPRGRLPMRSRAPGMLRCRSGRDRPPRRRSRELPFLLGWMNVISGPWIPDAAHQTLLTENDGEYTVPPTRRQGALRGTEHLRGPPLPRARGKAYRAARIRPVMSPDVSPVEGRAELDRMRAEIAVLREAVRSLSAMVAEHRELVSNINSIVLRWDPAGRILFLNEYGQDFFGYTLHELIGRSVVGTIVPQTETSGRDLARLMHDVLRHPERYLSNENENMRRDGQRVWVTWRNRPVLDESGDLKEIVSTGIDTTTRKHAEEGLRDSERRYRVLFQSTPVALLEGDASALKDHL